MFKTLKTIIAVAVAFTLVSTSAYSDAISKWAKGEFSLSTLSEKERIKALAEKKATEEKMEKLKVHFRNYVQKNMKMEQASKSANMKVEEVTEKEELSKLRPPLSGDEIMDMFDLEPGPSVGIIMKALYEQRINDGEVSKDEAIKLAEKVYKKL